MPFRHRLPTFPPTARKCIAFALLLLGLPCASPAWAGDSGIASRAQRVEAVARQMPRPDDLAFAQEMQRAYASAFGGIDDAARLREESDADLRLHWQAVESAALTASNETPSASALSRSTRTSSCGASFRPSTMM